jgi:hypothetical protein
MVEGKCARPHLHNQSESTPDVEALLYAMASLSFFQHLLIHTIGNCPDLCGRFCIANHKEITHGIFDLS